MDSRPFAGLHRPGYDIAVVWDYCEPTADWEFARPYAEICIVAWSLGVSVASVASGVTAAIDSRVTLRMAVNGTTTPINDTLGIPRALFEATAANLSEASLIKFYRRTCGRDYYSRFIESRPCRKLDSVARELDVFLNTQTYESSNAGYDRALVGRFDAIFPPDNQLRAWEEVPVDDLDCGHLPDFQQLLNQYIIDKDTTATRFAAGSASYDINANVQKTVVDELLHVSDSCGAFARPGKILEVGCGTGFLSRRLARLPKPDWSLEMWDLAPAEGLEHYGTIRRGDAEVMVHKLEPCSYRLIISASTIQWFNSPIAFLRQCARALCPDGLLIVSTFGPDNLKEIQAATGLGLPAMSAEQWSKLQIPGLSIEKVAEDRKTLFFDKSIEVFRHLKSTGVNSLGNSNPAYIRRALATMNPDCNGLYALTYHPVYIVFKANKSICPNKSFS